MVELLLDAGAEVNATDVDGNSPLHLATDRSFAGVCSMLLIGGASLEARNHQGQTPLELVKHIDTFHLLFDYARKVGVPLPPAEFTRTLFHNVLLRNSRVDLVNRLLHKASTLPNPNELKKL
jgi:hypothetical protein